MEIALQSFNDVTVLSARNPLYKQGTLQSVANRRMAQESSACRVSLGALAGLFDALLG